MLRNVLAALRCGSLQSFRMDHQRYALRHHLSMTDPRTALLRPLKSMVSRLQDLTRMWTELYRRMWILTICRSPLRCLLMHCRLLLSVHRVLHNATVRYACTRKEQEDSSPLLWSQTVPWALQRRSSTQMMPRAQGIERVLLARASAQSSKKEQPLDG